MSAIVKRIALLGETASMALDTLRSNKMRSALTVLGIVIGITSIVGMTALIRGFDESLRDSIRALGPKTIFVQRFGAVSFSSGARFLDLIRRPTLKVEDGEAIRRLAPSVALVDTWLGAGAGQPTQERIFYHGQRTQPLVIMGTSETFVDVNFAKIVAGRSFTEQEVRRRRNAVREERHRPDR
jgi:putative ABC transport system permease protein